MLKLLNARDLKIKKIQHIKLLGVLVFAIFLMGVFITRGHAMLAVIAVMSILWFTSFPSKFPQYPAKIWLLFGAFSAIAIATSALFSPDKIYALGSAAAAIGFISIGLFLWDYAKNITNQEANKLHDYSRIAVRVSSVLLTALLTMPVLLQILHPSQVAESVINRSVVAHVLLSGIFILASIGRKQTADAWIIYIWASVLAFISQSETAKLVCVVAPLVFLAFNYLGAFARVLSCSIIVAYSMAAPWLAGPFFAFIKDLPRSSATFRGAFGARAEIWDGVAQMVQRNPLQGYGFESMRIIKDLPIEGIFWTERAISHPHNMALQVWADMGVFGAIIVALAFCAAIWASRKLSKIEAASVCSFIVMVFLICQISHGAWQSWWLGLLALCGFLIHMLVIKPVSEAALANFDVKDAQIVVIAEPKAALIDIQPIIPVEIIVEEETPNDNSEQLCMLEQLDSTIDTPVVLDIDVQVKSSETAVKKPRNLRAPAKNAAPKAIKIKQDTAAKKPKPLKPVNKVVKAKPIRKNPPKIAAE